MKKSKAISWTISLFLLVISILFLYNKYRVAPVMVFKSLELFDSGGLKANTDLFKGKKLIVCYYASWCGDCLRELKSLNEIKNTKLKDVEVICITDETQEKLFAFQEKRKYPFHFYRIKKSFSDIGVYSIPVNYLINTKGQTVFEKVGSIDWKDNSNIQRVNILE